MDWSNTFLVEYFFLIVISLVMVVNSILRFRQHPRISTYTIIIITASLILSIAKTLDYYGKDTGNIPLTTFCSFLGYVLNAFCIFFFIMMTGQIKSKKHLFILLIPLIINALVYTLMFIPTLNESVVYFTKKEDGTLGFHGGPLRFCSHIMSALYLGYLIYLSITKISSKHFAHGLTIISCALFVVIAVVIESFFNGDDSIHILSTTIALSTVVYYLYLYIEKSQIDVLTGLFNRETYFRDIEKMGNSINGVIQFDMNGLKFVNDNFGHLEGDKALSTIANIITSCARRNMYVYRLGGDEFVLVSTSATEAQLKETSEKFKDRLSTTEYHCSIGVAFRKNKQQTVTELFKEAEEKMYEDKANFYKDSPFERRKV